MSEKKGYINNFTYFFLSQSEDSLIIKKWAESFYLDRIAMQKLFVHFSSDHKN